MGKCNVSARVWNECQAAEYLGMKVSTLRHWRYNGKGPKYMKFPASQTVRYAKDELDQFLNNSIIVPQQHNCEKK
jgi:hypothetical protein